MIYRTYPLDIRNDQITGALVMIHGTNRDADNYYRNALASAFLGGALENTVVIAPRIASNDRGCQDKLAANEVSYSCGGDSWRSGGIAANNDKLTSFDFIDEVLRKLARKQAFPNLKHIVVAGHSAGGQFVNRYEMANQVHETLGVPVSYIVANPSSYAYPDNTRPNAADWPVQAGAPGYVPEQPAGRGGRGGAAPAEGESGAWRGVPSLWRWTELHDFRSVALRISAPQRLRGAAQRRSTEKATGLAAHHLSGR